MQRAFGNAAPIIHFDESTTELRLVRVKHGPGDGAFTEPLHQYGGCAIDVGWAQRRIP
jgi:hypothetical protein